LTFPSGRVAFTFRLSKDPSATRLSGTIVGICGLLATRCLVAAATEEASKAEQEAEVVPSSVVVDLVDIEVVFE
jgi:hypothetical protein